MKGLLGFATVILALTTNLQPVLAQSDPSAVVQQYIEADNRGDTAVMLGLLSDDTSISGLGLCAQSPCVGKAAIEREIARGQADKTQHTIVGMDVSGNTATARLAHQNEISRAAGVDRFIVISTFTVTNGKISAVQRKFDTSDPQTVTFAAYAKSLAAAQPSNAVASAAPFPIALAVALTALVLAVLVAIGLTLRRRHQPA